MNLLILQLVLLFYSPSQQRGQPAEYSSGDNTTSAQEVLEKVLETLASLKTISYTYQKQANYFSEGYVNQLTAQSYLDFTAPDSILGVRFQFDSDAYRDVYNGSENFTLLKKANTIKLNNKPTKEGFRHAQFLYDSPLTLKNALPHIIADQRISKRLWDTLINNQSFFVLEFVLEKQTLDALGNRLPISMVINHIFRLTVDKSSFLPLAVWHGKSLNQDYTLTRFIDLKLNPAAPLESSWYYSSFLPEYQLEKPGERVLIKEGQQAADWQLPTFAGKEPARLAAYRGKLVLLEFWIAHCGYCISAVADLNAIREKYQDGEFVLLGINTHDSREVISLFSNRNKVSFPILYQGEQVAEAYGVEGYPTVVLLDKEGRVIYAGHFERNKVESLIEKTDK